MQTKHNFVEWHQQKLYPFLFQEDMYMMSSKSTKIYQFNQNNDSKLSFIRIKRIINRIRYEGFLSNDSFGFEKNYKSSLRTPLGQNRKKCFNTLTLQSIECLLNKKHKEFQQKNIYEQFSINSNIYNSIQIAPMSIEYKWISYHSIFEGNFYSSLHPEIIVRILRQYIEDISFLHLFRQILHNSIFIFIKKTDSNRKNFWDKLSIFLFNLYMIQIDKFFVSKKPFFLINNKSSNQKYDENISCLKKIKTWNVNIFDRKDAETLISKTKKVSYKVDSLTYQYIRTRNIWLLNLNIGSQKPDFEKIHKRYINFLENRLGYIHKYRKFRQFLVDTATNLLGYKLQFKLKKIVVRIERISSILLTKFKKKAILILNPLLDIIDILAKHNFCNSLGYPISKSGWSTLPDSVIIVRFKQIRESLINYYSGSINQKDLMRLQHILHYSCAKTLACKHKTNLRKIWKKYGYNLSINDFYIQKKISFVCGSPGATRLETKLYSRQKRCWNLYFKQPDPISILLEKTFRYKQFPKI